MNFIKRNKGTIIAVSIFLIALVILVQIKNMFFPNERKAIYGNRLDGISEVKITDDKKNQVQDSLDESVQNTSVRVTGRTVNIILTVINDVSVETAKGYAEKCLEPFSEQQKEYYDFQVFIKKEIETGEFPIIGYKQHTKDSFTWTKDRTGTES